MASGALAFLGEFPDGSWGMSQGGCWDQPPAISEFSPGMAQQFVTRENRKFGGGGGEGVNLFDASFLNQKAIQPFIAH